MNELARQDPDLFQRLPLNEHERKLLGEGETKYSMVENLQAEVRSGQIDVGLRLSPGRRGNVSSADRCEIIFNPQNMRARAMAQALEARLREVQEDLLVSRLKQLGVVDLRGLRIEQQRIYPQSDSTQSLATLVPLVLVLMTVTGAVYPAIDLTAGERERGTMEALIAAPIPRLGLLFAKYIAVITVAVLTATANLVAMMLTLYTSGLGAVIFGTESLGLGAMATIFALMILFASFFSAVLLAVTSFAQLQGSASVHRSFDSRRVGSQSAVSLAGNPVDELAGRDPFGQRRAPCAGRIRQRIWLAIRSVGRHFDRHLRGSGHRRGRSRLRQRRHLVRQ